MNEPLCVGAEGEGWTGALVLGHRPMAINRCCWHFQINLLAVVEEALRSPIYLGESKSHALTLKGTKSRSSPSVEEHISHPYMYITLPLLRSLCVILYFCENGEIFVMSLRREGIVVVVIK